MSEPTPTLDEIKSWYADEYRCNSGMSLEEGEAAFDRAIAAHDTVLREQIAAEIAAAAECRSWIADSALIQGMREAAEIARGEA